MAMIAMTAKMARSEVDVSCGSDDKMAGCFLGGV